MHKCYKLEVYFSDLTVWSVFYLQKFKPWTDRFEYTAQPHSCMYVIFIREKLLLGYDSFSQMPRLAYRDYRQSINILV